MSKTDCIYSGKCGVGGAGCVAEVANAKNCTFFAVEEEKDRILRDLMYLLKSEGTIMYVSPAFISIRMSVEILSQLEFDGVVEIALDRYAKERNAEMNFCTLLGDGKCSFSHICSKKILQTYGCALLELARRGKDFCGSMLECNKKGITCAPEIAVNSGCAVAKQQLSKMPVAEILFRELKEKGFYPMYGPWYEALVESFPIYKKFEEADFTARKNFTMAKLFGLNPNGGRHAVREKRE